MHLLPNVLQVFKLLIATGSFLSACLLRASSYCRPLGSSISKPFAGLYLIFPGSILPHRSFSHTDDDTY